MISIFKRVSQLKFIAVLAFLISRLVPNFNRLKKYKNILQTIYSINQTKTTIANNPISVRIAPITICNYKCLFCEIHKDDLLYPNRNKNSLCLKDIKKYESFLSTSYALNFYGGSAEPLINKYFGDIVTYLKSKYHIKMFVTTNASMLKKRLVDTMIDYGFDNILISYHAGTEAGYKYLMSGNINKVDGNISYLTKQKKKLRKRKPVFDFNFALQKINANEFKSILNKAEALGARGVIVNKYYGGRNRIQDKRVSFEYDVNAGNRVLNEIYSYGRKKSIKIFPSKPVYWEEKPSEWNPDDFDTSIKCIAPWVSIHFNPVLSDDHCHYVGVCNRIELFKIDYKEVKFNLQNEFNTLWNHLLLQYLRATVNSKNINPICKYCKNSNRETIRNKDAGKYAQVRDRAVKDFFKEYSSQCNVENFEGIEVLTENPSSDQKVLSKLSGLIN